MSITALLSLDAILIRLDDGRCRFIVGVRFGDDDNLRIIAQTAPFSNVVAGAVELKKLLEQGLTPALHGKALADMKAAQLPLGLRWAFLGRFLLPLYFLLQRLIDAGRKLLSPPRFDVAMPLCGEDHEHLVLTRNGRPVAQEPIELWGELPPFLALLKRWGAEYRIPEAAVAQLTSKVDGFIEAATTYGLGLAADNRGISLYKNRGTLETAAADNALSIFEVLVGWIRKFEIPPRHHEKLAQQAIGCVHALLEVVQQRRTATRMETFLRGDVCQAIVKVDEVVVASTEIGIADPERLAKLLGFCEQYGWPITVNLVGALTEFFQRIDAAVSASSSEEEGPVVNTLTGKGKKFPN